MKQTRVRKIFGSLPQAMSPRCMWAIIQWADTQGYDIEWKGFKEALRRADYTVFRGYSNVGDETIRELISWAWGIRYQRRLPGKKKQKETGDGQRSI